MRKFLLISLTALFACNPYLYERDEDIYQGRDYSGLPGAQPDSYTEEQDNAVTDLRPGENQDELIAYNTNQFDVALFHPRGWRVQGNDPTQPYPVINLYSTRYEGQFDLPLTLSDNPSVSHISFYPLGLRSELPSGRNKTFSEMGTLSPVPFQIDRDASYVFLLENGFVWGYLLKPVDPPIGWSDQGFIFVQIGVDNFESRCLNPQTGELKFLQDCNLPQDVMVRLGNINTEERRQVFDMLASLRIGMADQRQYYNGPTGY